jgi:acetyl esterase/lipase
VYSAGPIEDASMRFISAILTGLCVVVLVALQVRGGDDKVRIERDLTYGKGGTVDLKLDLALPAEGKGPFPAVLCLHGGGWRGGSRQQLDGLIKLLAQKGFVAATASYRLTDKAPFPAQIQDCKAAVRWLRANAEKYRIRPDKIGAVGFSAGAHLASLLGTADKSADLEGDGGNPEQSSRVQAVVSFFGPSDFTVKTWDKKVEDYFLVPFFGGSFEEKKDLYRKASPLVYVTRDDPPFLFFHGTKDPLVGIENSEKMVKKLDEVGVSARLVTMTGDGHGWGGEKLAKSLDETARFFTEKLKK